MQIIDLLNFFTIFIFLLIDKNISIENVGIGYSMLNFIIAIPFTIICMSGLYLH